MMAQKDKAPQQCDQQSYIDSAREKAEKKTDGLRNLILAAVILTVSIVGSILMTAFPGGRIFEAEGLTEMPASSGAQGVYMTININTAGPDELVLLPGVDETIANNIILFREAHDGFDSVYDLCRVSGMNLDKLDIIKDLVTVGKTGK